MQSLFAEVLKFYLESRDFNGLALRDASQATLDEAATLVKAGRLEVISTTDWMNPHIRPWSSGRSLDEQLQDIADSADDRLVVCLYPTAAALAEVVQPGLLADQPYRRRQAEGGGNLEVAYFRIDVLEAYRNDPRYHFEVSDFGLWVSVTDAVYEDAEEHEDDKTSIHHVGFAYDMSTFDRDDETTPITRRVCAFLYDLGNLTPTHQQRWRTYEVPAVDGLQPHPVWRGAQILGRWPDGLGPFARLLFELQSLNELHRKAFGVDLLKSTERPREFGWILRPSQQEFDAFIHQLDKLLSENLRHDAFDKAGVPKMDDKGQAIGTLNRLDRLLERNGLAKDVRREILKPIKDVRVARQKPAHALRTNVTDKTFVRRQARLLQDVTASVVSLREHWQSHPANAGWSEPEYISNGRHYWL
ncbi:hypothetical protein AB0M20_27025 [Actinoplanes sp. NPDC051633]|uniref:hypothetical protein n=1 Tax=Actinoplanes sp. NPDC051633 TaxID=3155670 RepID=UPI0034412C3D